MRALALVVLMLTTSLAGCVAPEPMLGELMEPTTQGDETPERMTIVAPTAGRSVDESPVLNVVASADGNATLLIWSRPDAAVPRLDGNDRDRSREGNYTDLRVVSVHRYPSFEDADEVIERYGTANTSTEATWPLLLPSDGDTVVNADTGEATTVDLVDAFEGPVTQPLQVLEAKATSCGPPNLPVKHLRGLRSRPPSCAPSTRRFFPLPGKRFFGLANAGIVPAPGHDGFTPTMTSPSATSGT
ncbi:MAG: hypothetical protein CM15mP128_1190 [Methanobacteriota archaeon]|nr:MAG: hypothetical protein CM15mP128_1190 [Euryarchaeota archaeon]